MATEIDRDILIDWLKSLLKNVKESEFNQFMFKKYIELKGSTKLAKYLNENGYKVKTESNAGERKYTSVDVTNYILDEANHKGLDDCLRDIVVRLVKYCGRANWQQRLLRIANIVYTAAECTFNRSKKDILKKARNSKPELTERQKLFAEIYVRNFNAKLAAIKAGYSPHTAYSIGIENLSKPAIRDYVEKLKEMKKKSLMVSEEDIVEKYMRIAFADMTDFSEFGQREVPIITKEGPIMVLNKETNQEEMLTQTVNSLNFKDSSEVDGGLICEIKTSRQGASIKLEDRQKALDWLARFFEMNPEHKHRKEHDRRKLQLERERFEHTKKMDSSKVW